MTKKSFRKMRAENINIVGSGQVAGIGVGPKGEPGVKKAALIRRKKFANCEVFVLDADRYLKCRTAKLRYERYARLVGEDEVGLAIREYAKSNPGKPIMIEDENTGAMTYLRLGRGHSISSIYGR